MLDLFRQIDISLAGLAAILVITLTIVAHGLVIFKVIPYKWVMGGMSKSFEAARNSSIAGSIVFAILIPFILVTSNLITVSLGGAIDTVFSVILWVLAVLLAANLIMQLLGTRFEKCVTSVLVGTLLIAVLRIALN